MLLWTSRLMLKIINFAEMKANRTLFRKAIKLRFFGHSETVKTLI